MPSVATSRRVSRAEAPLEADLPAELAADRPAALVGDPRRDRSRRDAPRLQQDHRSVVEQRRRHAGRLAGAGLRGDDTPRETRGRRRRSGR